VSNTVVSQQNISSSTGSYWWTIIN
jgi:hypothetical protein